MRDLDGIAYTQGPGLAGALLVGASVASALAYALGMPAIGVHHLEGHLLSPLLSADPPALSVRRAAGLRRPHPADAGGRRRRYELLGETLDDAAGEAFDKTAKLLGPRLSRRAGAVAPRRAGQPGRYQAAAADARQRRSRISASADLKTAVLTPARQQARPTLRRAPTSRAASRTRSSKCWWPRRCAALEATGLDAAGGRRRRRRQPAAARRGCRRSGARARASRCSTRSLQLCTDNGAMIAFAGALRLAARAGSATRSFTVRPRWDLEELAPAWLACSLCRRRCLRCS